MMNDFQQSSIDGYQNSPDASDRSYLNDYWLDIDRLITTWADVLENAFIIREGKVSIAPVKEVDVRMGGLLFTEEEFEEFRCSSLSTGAKTFVVIEDVGQTNWRSFSKKSFFRFLYPLNVKWERIAQSCDLADDIYFRPIRAYFVVSDNGRVGKYANNDAVRPYDLLFHEKE